MFTRGLVAFLCCNFEIDFAEEDAADAAVKAAKAKLGKVE